MQSAQPGSIRRGGKLRRGITTCAIAASMAFGVPLVEAQPQPGVPPAAKRPAARPPPAPTAAKQLYTVTGMKVTINYGGKDREVYVMAKGVKPLVKLEGPAEVTVRVYPAVLKSAFAKTPEFVHQIECSSGPADQAQTTGHFSGKTRDSQIQSKLVAGTIAIGTPIQFMVKVEKGKQQLSVTKPNGFFEVVGVKPVTVKPRQPPRRTPRIRLTVDPPKKVEKPKKAEKPKRTLLTMNATRVQVGGLGPDANKGDIYETTLLGHIPMSPYVSLIVGAAFNSFGLAIDAPEARTSIRGLTSNLAFGVSYTRGRHSLTALGLGGYRHMWSEVRPSGDAAIKNQDSEGEGGGVLSYSYDRYLTVMALARSNHFNPLVGRVVGTLPWGLPWVKGHNPSLDVTYSWLKAAVKHNVDSETGGATMSYDVHDLLMVADLPFLKLGMFTLSAIAGAELTMAKGESVWATGLFGGTVGMEHKGVSVKLTGYSSLEGMPFLFLNFAYSR